MAAAAHWCTQIYRLYCVAERRLREWRARYPAAARWAIDVPAGVLTAAVFYGDVFSDALIASELYGASQGTWTALCILLRRTRARVKAFLLRILYSFSCLPRGGPSD